MSQSLRVTSSLVARVARTSIRVPRRAFAVSAVKNDTIQDMYLKELKVYKPPPVKASDSEGVVKKFSPPAIPKSPEETNLAQDMKAYEDQVVETEGQAAPGETHEAADNYFEDLEELNAEQVAH